MGKEKDIEWYEKKMKDLKNRKRSSCASIPEGEYDSAYYVNNKKIKKMKEVYKKEKRSFKRAEKKN